MSLRLVRVAPDEVPWAELDHRPGRSPFQTRAWLEALHAVRRVEPVVARVVDGPATVGWFAGGVARRAGWRLLGSPLPGWTSSYMGFTLDDPGRTGEALVALRRFAFADLGCVHLEVLDRAAPARPPGPGWEQRPLPGWQVDLSRGDDELLGAMSAMARRNVRTAARRGVTVEPLAAGADLDDLGAFAAEHVRQARWAFARRGRDLPYDESLVVAALRLLGPAGHVVALRARDADGTPVASALLPGVPGAAAVLWLVAGDGRARAARANEALVWAALGEWRSRGATALDLGGGGDYKAKFGGTPISVPWWRTSRLAVVEPARRAVVAVHRRARRRGGTPRGRP